MKHVNRTLLMCLAILWLLPLQAAQAGYTAEVKPRSTDGEVHWNPVAGEYRREFFYLSDFALDAETPQTQNPIHSWGEHRIRWSPSLNWKDLYFKVDLDILHGQLYGDHENFAEGYWRYDRREENEGTHIEEILPRNAYIQWYSPIGLLKVGQMTSGYGLGVLGNSGEDNHERFGTTSRGDIVDRVLFATTPFLPLTGEGAWGEYLTLVLAGDLVYQDENAKLRDGDIAAMATVGLYYRMPEFSNGFSFTYRWQEDDDGDKLKTYVFNINGQNRFTFAPNELEMAFELNYEAALIIGNTTRWVQESTPDGLDLFSYGAVAQAKLEFVEVGFNIEFEVGYASGDNDPYDDTSHAFFFDPDFNVGMIFFDEMLPLITARSVEVLDNPNRTAKAPKGIDLVATQGRVTNTIYYLPQLRYSPHLNLGLKEHLTFLAGALVITTPSYFSHAYYSFEKGGTPVNHLRRPTDSRYIGTEVLGAVRLDIWPQKEHVGLRFGIEQAYFIPGMALADPNGDKPDGVYKVMGTMALMWQ